MTPFAERAVCYAPVGAGELEGRREAEPFRLLAESDKNYVIFVVDPKNRVRHWNPGAERLLGYPEAEVARRLLPQTRIERAVLASLSGWGQQGDCRRSAEAGFAYHLVKPAVPQTVEKVLLFLNPRDPGLSVSAGSGTAMESLLDADEWT